MSDILMLGNYIASHFIKGFTTDPIIILSGTNNAIR